MWLPDLEDSTVFFILFSQIDFDLGTGRCSFFLTE